jgi:thiamine kinase-like enzyme
VQGVTPDEAEFTVVALARFHASWWESTKLHQYPWLKEFDWNADAYQERYNVTYATFLELTRGAIPDNLATLGDRLRHNVAAVKHELSQPPITFLHGDFHANNLFITDNPRVLAVVDWQVCSRGRAARDLMYFLAGSLALETRRVYDIDLIRKYHAELSAHGVTNYSLNQCIRDCRFALLDLMFFMVTIICLLDFNVNDEARAVRSVILERFGGAILDHRAEELLP